MGNKNIKRIVGFLFIGVCIFLVLYFVITKFIDYKRIENSTYIYANGVGTVLYDNTTYKVYDRDSELNDAYYGFDELDNYRNLFVKRDLTTAQHSIVEFNGNQINTIYELNENTDTTIATLFPLTIYKGRYFFVKSRWLIDPSTNRSSFLNSTILEFKDGELYPFENVSDAVVGGTILNGKMYYVCYNDSTNLYDVKFFDINDYNSTATHLYSDSVNTNIMNLGNKLYVKTTDEPYYYAIDINDGTVDENDSIYLGPDRYNHSDNYYSIDKNVYFLLEPGDVYKKYNLKIIDGTTKEVLKQYDNYIAHKADLDKIIIYTSNGVFDFTR